MQEKVDVFVGNHVWNNKTDKKLAELENSEKNPFVNPEEWNVFLEERISRLNSIVTL